MMAERLTEHGDHPCVHCEGIGSCLIDCDNKKIYEKLQYYEDLEEAGRLIELPCKEIYTSIGDTVYYIYYDEVVECVNCGVQIGCDGKAYIDFACDVPDIVDDYADEWGKTIFLTKEEAEAALKESESE